MVRFLALGGVGEIGKNMALLECGPDAILIDAGLRFPRAQESGVDIVLPDIGFVRTRLPRLRGVVLTHGHEDHIGALPFYISELGVPVYGTAVTLGLLRNKLERRGHRGRPDLREVGPGHAVRLGGMDVEFIAMTHSVPGSCGLAITTAAGLVVHTGDFKLDQTPVGGPPPDLRRLAKLGEEGVLLLLSDSTNAPRPGVTPSEVTVGPALARVMEAPGRVVVVTFASNLARIQQALELAWAAGRRCCLVGRSMLRNVDTGQRLGIIPLREGGLLAPRQLAGLPDRQVCLVATGTQGEPLAALSRIARATHPFLRVHRGDTFVLAANPIPGNEAVVAELVNQLVLAGATVLAGSADGVHASGHGAAEELRFVLALTRPRYFAPVHGEPWHLEAHRQLALRSGQTPESVAELTDGLALEVGEGGMRLAGWVRPAEVGIGTDREGRERPRPTAAPAVVEVGVSPDLSGWRHGPELVTAEVRAVIRGDHRRWRAAVSHPGAGRDGLVALGERIGAVADLELGGARAPGEAVLPVVSLTRE